MSNENSIHDSTPVTLRIVAWGPRDAGKSETLKSLAAGLNQQAASEGNGVRSSEYFEWMDYVGGRHHGQPIEVQFVVIGNDTPPSVIQYLFESANSVMFVADSTSTGVDESVALFREVFRFLSTLGPPPPPVVVQANRRSDTDVIPGADLRDRLDLDDEVTLVETFATTGAGTRQAFVYAVRNGLEHYTASTDEIEPRPALESSPEELGARLALVESGSSVADVEAEPAPASAPESAPVSGPEPARTLDEVPHEWNDEDEGYTIVDKPETTSPSDDPSHGRRSDDPEPSSVEVENAEHAPDFEIEDEPEFEPELEPVGVASASSSEELPPPPGPDSVRYETPAAAKSPKRHNPFRRRS